MEMLNKDFNLSKFGIQVRLVTEDDAPFIYTLRSDKILTKHIHSFDGTFEDQKEWIRKYKEREVNGEEYYFIYEINHVPFGVNRIYSIKNEEGTTGSWICLPGTSPIYILATSIILYDIVFDVIKLNKALYDTRKDNSSALKVNRALGGEYLYETDLDFYFELLPEKYHSVRDKLVRLWHLK